MSALSSLFISHSSRDRVVAADIGQRLRSEGYEDLFLDFDPEQGIPAGRSWEREIYAQLCRVDGVVFLASTESVASKWCFAELVVARLLSKPIFPLRLDGSARLSSLNDVQWIDLTGGEDPFPKLWAGLRQAGFDPHDSFAWDSARSPYPGLQAFAPEDAAVFFGRDDKIDELMDRLAPFTRGASQIVTIVGPSGSGKSSLLRAGLLPRLARVPDRWVVLAPSRRPAADRRTEPKAGQRNGSG
jgi:Novel STAND NTPase 1/TIR domain